MSETTSIVPKIVFVVPYRDRPQQKFFFRKYMNFILEDKDYYEIYFSHQSDARTFNRGATKNIGFIAVKEKYPNHYKDITFIFNDVDTLPFNKIFDYDTTHGIVKHYYGFEYALGGIVVIKGSDFERTNGFPCFWGWGMEDNAFQKRCQSIGLKIDRSCFYPIGSKEILQLFDGVARIISKKDTWRSENDNGVDGLITITNLQYTLNDSSTSPNDNIFTIEDNKNKTFYINIHTFLTYITFGSEDYSNYDLRSPKRAIIHPDKIRSNVNKAILTIKDWSEIPYFPTTKIHRENVAKYLLAMGKEIPLSLKSQIIEDNKSLNPETFNGEKKEDSLQYAYQNDYRNYNQHYNQHYNQYYNQHSNQQFTQPPNTAAHNNIPPHKFSHEYAAFIGAKPKAQSSARIKLGGVF
jgi:N-terminal region of glycosyl transferase group 7